VLALFTDRLKIKDPGAKVVLVADKVLKLVCFGMFTFDFNAKFVILLINESEYE
jgi:hypothetical protein